MEECRGIKEIWKDQREKKGGEKRGTIIKGVVRESANGHFFKEEALFYIGTDKIILILQSPQEGQRWLLRWERCSHPGSVWTQSEGCMSHLSPNIQD